MQATRTTHERGFSLLELMIVVAISMITLAMTIPMLSTSVAQYRLRTSAVDLNSLMQRARVQAIRDNRTYTLRGCNSAGTCTNTIDSTSQRILVDLNGNGAYDGGEPVIQMQRGITITTAASPTITASALGFTPNGTVLAFTSRGTPCTGSPCAQNGFVVYMTGATGSNSTGLSAISVSPSGRFRSWSYDPHGGWSQ